MQCVNTLHCVVCDEVCGWLCHSEPPTADQPATKHAPDIVNTAVILLLHAAIGAATEGTALLAARWLPLLHPALLLLLLPGKLRCGCNHVSRE